MTVSYGVFDGVHLGHQALLANHPDKLYLLGLPKAEVLTTAEERRILLARSASADTQIVESASAPSYKEAMLMLDSGHPDHASATRLIEPITYEGSRITSERIRQALREGRTEQAEAMLGYPYTLSGEVVYGRQLGRTVGMPTVNLSVDPSKLLPKHGVYGTITIVDGQRFLGVTSIGPRPTVDDSSRVTIETFLLHFSRDLYGQHISLEVKTFIRPITKFENLEAVRRKVDEDVLYVMEKGLL